MLYLGYVFMIPNEKLQLQKNQLIWSATGWSKAHILLSLTPADAYLKLVSWIKDEFSIRRNWLPHIQEDILNRPAAWAPHNPWLKYSGLMDSVRFSVFPKTSTHTQLWFSARWGNPWSPALILQRAYQKPLGVETLLYYTFHQHRSSERLSSCPDGEPPFRADFKADMRSVTWVYQL